LPANEVLQKSKKERTVNYSKAGSSLNDGVERSVRNNTSFILL